MSRRDTAVRLLLLRLIGDRVKEADADARRQARADFDVVGVREVGTVDGQPIGTVQLNKGRETWTVTDPAALLRWVKENVPDEVETTERVRESYVKALLARAKKDGVAVDVFTGEAIPGIEYREAQPTLNVKPTDDAQQIVAQAFADGTLSLDDLMPPLPIEGPTSDG